MWSKKVTQPIYFYRKQLFFAGVACLVFLLGLNILATTGKNSAKALGEGDKILTVSENGVRTSFKTNAKTVREALKEQKIEIAKQDSAEPSLDDELTATDYNVNIYRAAPVVVADDFTRVKVMTSSQTPALIAKDAGIKLYDEDKISLETSENPLEDGATSYYHITRAKLITVELYGKKTEFRTQAKTVGEFIKEKNISLTKDDVVSVDQNTQIKNGLDFKIWRNGKQTITVDEEVDFETEQIKDADKDTDYKQIKEAGEKGSKAIVYEIEMRNGQEVSRTKISEAQTKAPKKQIEVVGTKAKTVSLPTGSHEDWMAAAGLSSSDYGYANHIFTKESGWRTTASNGKYYGLGQTTLANLSRTCPNWQSDPVCQIRHFNSYAVSRYGSWTAAYNFWLKNHWW